MFLNIRDPLTKGTFIPEIMATLNLLLLMIALSVNFDRVIKSTLVFPISRSYLIEHLERDWKLKQGLHTCNA